MGSATLLDSIAGRHAVLALRDVEALEFCGIDTPHCLAKILGADSLGLWVEHPGWGEGVLAEERPGRLFIRWANVEAILVLSGGELSHAELCCLAEAPQALRPIGFRPEPGEAS